MVLSVSGKGRITNLTFVIHLYVFKRSSSVIKSCGNRSACMKFTTKSLSGNYGYKHFGFNCGGDQYPVEKNGFSIQISQS